MRIDVYKITDEALNTYETDVGTTKVPPIWGNALTAEDYSRLIHPRYERLGDVLTPAEVGCTLSHLHAYRLIAARGKPSLILEEDIELNKISLEAVTSYVNFWPVDFLQAGAHGWSGGIRRDYGRPVALGLFVGYPRIGMRGTFAYFIRPRVAEQLLKFHDEELRRADQWDEFFHARDVVPYFAPIFLHPPERGNLDVQRREQRTLSTPQLASISFNRILSGSRGTMASVFRRIFNRRIRLSDHTAIVER